MSLPPLLKNKPKPKRVPYPVWKSAKFTLADAKALQALAQGVADEEQQIRALKWIVNSAGMINRMTYQPGGDDAGRDSIFAEGRRFVALQTMRLITTNLEDLKGDDAIQREDIAIENDKG
jgi:hypothetical protein